MEFWLAILLGIIQGFIEFLPISSSGHLVIAEHVFNADMSFLFLNVMLHLASLLAVIVYYRKTIWYMIKNPFCKLNKMLAVATIPAVVFVLITKSFVSGANESVVFVGAGFLVTAVLLSVSGFLARRTVKAVPLGYRSSLFMGLGQALAVFPGISRSGTTLAVGLMDGVERKSALEFSFLMSIPIIIASGIYEIVFDNAFAGISAADWAGIGVAGIAAFFAGILGIITMKKVVEKISFKWFVIYLIAAGALTLIFVK